MRNWGPDVSCQFLFESRHAEFDTQNAAQTHAWLPCSNLILTSQYSGVPVDARSLPKK